MDDKYKEGLVCSVPTIYACRAMLQDNKTTKEDLNLITQRLDDVGRC